MLERRAGSLVGKGTAAAFTILDEKHHYTGWPICMCTAAVYRLLALSL